MENTKYDGTVLSMTPGADPEWAVVELPADVGPVHLLVLTGGYVESAMTSCLILWSGQGYATVEDALTMVSLAFRTVVESEVRRAVVSPTPCPHCDKPWPVAVLDEEELEAYIYEYMTSHNDGSHDFWESLQDHGWSTSISDAPRAMWSTAVVVHEMADQILADIAFGGRTVVERGSFGDDHTYDWPTHMHLQPGMVLYRSDS